MGLLLSPCEQTAEGPHHTAGDSIVMDYFFTRISDMIHEHGEGTWSELVGGVGWVVVVREWSLITGRGGGTSEY